MNDTLTIDRNMVITESATQQIAHIQQKQGNAKLALRITVLGGGCSGFQYELLFDDTEYADDVRFEKNGASVVTDESSLPFLQNAIIDYERSLMGSAFKIKNPNAASGCGCGKSFAIKM